MSFATSPIVGVDFANPSSDRKFALGTTVQGDNGTTWIYVKATTALTQYDVCAINEDCEAVPATSALALQGKTPSFAQVAFTVNYYGWVALRGAGGLRIRTAASTTKDSKLYVGLTGNSAGVVGSTSGTGTTLLNGVVTVATAASAGVKPEIIATNPWFTP